MTRLSKSRARLWMVPARAEPSMWKRVVTCRRTSSRRSLRIFPNREIWVSSQNAIDEEKYARGGGAVSSPSSQGPSSQAIS